MHLRLEEGRSARRRVLTHVTACKEDVKIAHDRERITMRLLDLLGLGKQRVPIVGILKNDSMITANHYYY